MIWARPGKLVGVRGFEPPTPASRRRCSTRLSYTPTQARAYRRAFRGPQAMAARRFAARAGRCCNGPDVAIFPTASQGSARPGGLSAARLRRPRWGMV